MKHIQKYTKNNGFTIVELVTVLVVIAILATLVGVSYAETQKGARAARYQTDATSIAKRAEISASDNDGQFPLLASDFSGAALLDSDSGVTIGSVRTSNDAEPTTVSNIAAPPAYTIKVCTNTREGIRVYYPDPETSSTAIKYVDAGEWSSSC